MDRKAKAEAKRLRRLQRKAGRGANDANELLANESTEPLDGQTDDESSPQDNPITTDDSNGLT